MSDDEFNEIANVVNMFRKGTLTGSGLMPTNIDKFYANY